MFEKNEWKNNLSILDFSVILLLVFGLFYLLYIWQALIIPFIISILFAFAILGLKNFYQRFKIPWGLAMFLSIVSYCLVFYFIWVITYTNAEELVKQAPAYQEKISTLIGNTINSFGIDSENFDLTNTIQSIFGSISLQSFFNSLLSTLTSISSNLLAIAFYTIFILIEAVNFEKKIELSISNPAKRKSTLKILTKIESDVKTYFVIKTFVSVLTALGSYFIMIAFGLNFAAFWALLIFILNFIPNIGSIIAVLFPAVLSLAQPEFTLYSSLFLTGLLIFVQMIVWNVIEPKMMWSRLNLSPLVIIISLSFWWYIWWIIWMLLSVPLMVIMNIILSKFEQTRPIAIFLSEKWELENEIEENFIDKKQKIIEKIKNKFKAK